MMVMIKVVMMIISIIMLTVASSFTMLVYLDSDNGYDNYAKSVASVSEYTHASPVSA